MGYNDWVNGLRKQNTSANIPASSGYKQWADNIRAQGAAISAAQQFLKSDVTSKMNIALKNPVAGAKQLIEADRQRTTIPSVNYDEDYVTEKRLKQEMEEAEKVYRQAQKQHNTNPVMKDLESLGINHKAVGPSKNAYEKKKKEYENFKKARYYFALPDGEVVSTNPQKAKIGSIAPGVDWAYEYINNINGVQDLVNSQDLPIRKALHTYSYMTDREIGIYNYLYAEKGAKEAADFLAFLNEDLEQRISAKSMETAQKFADEHPYAAAALSIPANLFSVGEQVSNMAEYAITGDLNRNNMADAANILRGELPEKVNWEIGNWDAFDFVYNTTMSGVDSLVVAPAGTVGAVALGLSAAASTTNDILDRGGTNAQAFWGGIAAGTFEGIFEKFSISQLNSMQEGMVTGFKDFAKNVAKSMLTNASEETATEIANILYDYAANGGISQYALLVKEYTDNGDDEKTAKKKAAQKLGLQILEAGASGALMGFGFGSLGSVSAYYNYKNSPEYQKAKTNSEILRMVDKVKNGDFKANDKVYLESVTPEVAETIKGITGIDVSDFKVAIEARQIEHILKDHGAEGKADRSMADDVDIAKMEYALSKPDDIRKAGKTRAYTFMKNGRNKTADTVLYEKVLDENSYYVVQAVPDTNKKTLYIVSAFIGKSGYKKEASQLTDVNSPSATSGNGSAIASSEVSQTVDAISPNATPNSGTVNTSSDITVPQKAQSVNNIISTDTQNNSQNPDSGAVDVAADIGDRVSILRNNTNRRHTTLKEQQYIRKICDALGVKVVFEDMAKYMKNNGMDTDSGIIEGYIDKNNVIHIGWTVSNPVQFVLKHELTHFLENNQAKYFDFANEVMDSQAFNDWVKSKGYSSNQEYNADIVKQYSQVDKSFNEHKANLEMVANFVGENLFGNENEINRLLESLTPNERSKFIQFVHDFLNWLKESLSGQTEIFAEINKLEEKFTKLLKEVSVEQKSSADSSNKYSFVPVKDSSLIAEAERMERNNADRKTIWQELNVIRDSKGEWIYEISDMDMKFNKSPAKYGKGVLPHGKLEEFLVHDKLFKKYPRLKETNFRFGVLNDGAEGNYDPYTDTITLSEKFLMESIEANEIDREFENFANELEMKNTLMHEIQHALQEYDDRERGASIEYWNRRAIMGDMPIGDDNRPLTPREAYKRTAGEIEARQTGERSFWSEDERKEEMPDFEWDKAVFTSKSYQLVHNKETSSKIDAEYLSAVENGDVKAIRNMVDNAAMSAGYTERLYHQTGADFTEFNTENQRAGKYDPELPTGTFLKPSNEDIGLAGKKQMELYAQIKNPLQFKDRVAAQEFWSENIDGYDDAIKAVDDVDAEYRQKYSHAEGEVRRYMISRRHSNPNASRQDIYNDVEFHRLYDEEQQVLEEWENKSNEASLKAKQLIDEFVSQSDYDGVIVEKDQDGDNISTKSYIVFNSNQLKDASPVTYDDSGEVIPLSARFDTEQGDIRYSFTMQMNAESMLEMYESGEITRQEYLDMVKKQKPLNPVEIANLTEEDADTTPHHSRRKGKSDGDKTSKFYGSLLESDIFDDTFKDEVREDTFIEKYKSVTNKETLKKAVQELDEGGQSYVNEWFRKEKEPERASLIDTAVGFILMDRYQRVGDYESAAAAAEVVRAFGTAGGQQIQIFSIIGRLDPNTMAVYAQKELSKAFETMTKGRTQKWIDKNAERFNLTEQDIEFIRRHTLQAAQLPEGRDKAIRLAEISTLLQDKLPAQKGQSIRALQRISMLLNPKTNIRNFVGNGVMVPVFMASDFFGSGIDRAISKKTGVRTTGMVGVKSVKGFKTGVFETMDDFRRHINTRNEELNRFDISVKNGKSFNEQHNGKLAKQLNDCAKVLNALDRFTSFCLEMGDRPFYKMWFVNSLNNQMKLNKVTEPTSEMIVIASTEALQRTWQDTNKVVKTVAEVKGALNRINIGGYGLGDVMIKFTKTPANLTKAIFDFSPAGVAKAILSDGRALKNAIETGRFEPSMQKKFVDSLSKGIAGTMLYILAAGLASAGKLSGGGDDDKDVSNFEKYIQGIPEYSVKLFGKWWSYEWMQPVGAVAATVTDYMKSKEENPDNEWYENVMQAIRSGGEVLYNQSFMTSIQILFTADSFIDGLIEQLMNEPSVYVPQLVSQLANATDDYRRVTYENDELFQTALNKVKLKLPGLRQTLEKQTDILGRDVPNSQSNWFNAFINPGNTFTDTSNAVTDELYKLYKQTGNKTVMPRVVPYSITVKGDSRVLSAEERNDFQRISGNTTSAILEIAFGDNAYKKLSDEEKVKFISKVYTFAAGFTKSSFEYDYDTLSAMVGEKKNGDPILTKSVYSKLREDDLQELAQEYFLSKTEMRFIDDYERLIQYYIRLVKE